MTATRQLGPVLVALVAMITIARTMSHAGMTTELAVAAAGIGAAWPRLSPVVGAFGTFVTGSATASNVLFTELQATTARAAELPALPLLGTQGFRASAGNTICPPQYCGNRGHRGPHRPGGPRAALDLPDRGALRHPRRPAGIRLHPVAGLRRQRAAGRGVREFSSSARCMAGIPARSSSWIRHDMPSARTTGSPARSCWSRVAGSKYVSATATEVS